MKGVVPNYQLDIVTDELWPQTSFDFFERASNLLREAPGTRLDLRHCACLAASLLQLDLAPPLCSCAWA